MLKSNHDFLNSNNNSQDENENDYFMNKTERRSLVSSKISKSKPIKGLRKDSFSNEGNNSLMPGYTGFSQSLGRFNSLKVLKHPHTECDIMDEINEEHDESLDNFLFSSSLSRD